MFKDYNFKVWGMKKNKSKKRLNKILKSIMKLTSTMPINFRILAKNFPLKPHLGF